MDQGNTRQARILIADDDRLVLSTLSAGLARAGYRIEAVDNAAEALAACEHRPPDLVILDHNMPGISGLEAAERIGDLAPDLPVLMLTAYDDTELVNRAIAAGVSGYFVKPVDSSQLVPTIELHLLRQRRAVRHGTDTGPDSPPRAARVGKHAPDAAGEYWPRESLLRDVIDRDHVEVAYQPILDIRTGTVSHYEALLRLRAPDGRLIATADCLPAAERSGLIRSLDYRVLELAAARLAYCQARHRELQLAVNVSGIHFGTPALRQRVRDVLRERGVDPRRLIFEVTETAAVRDLEQATRFILELKELGCQFALDDFGAGYASFYYLKVLPLDFVKIDGAFIRDLARTERDQLFVRAMVDVARGLGIRTIAEYVSDQPTLELLDTLGVDFAQGFHIGRPEPLLPDDLPAGTADTAR